jgi:hypothetical protein
MRCPLCNQESRVEVEFKTLVRQGRCDRCGYIHITEDAVAQANKTGKLHIISAWFRRINSREVPLVESQDIATIVKDTPEYTPLEKLDRTLVTIFEKTLEPGQRSKFEPQNDYPLIYARSAEEAAFYIRQLAGLGYVHDDHNYAMVLAKGFQRLMEIQKSGRTSNRAFVAMSFAKQMNDIYDNAIEPAISMAGYKPIRVDRTEHVNRIDDEIIGQIKASRFMVADFTGHRQGVYFESGMMLGLGRTVVWMCKDDELAASHFDTRQYNFINYKSAEEARKRVYDRIMAIEGAGPEKKDA